MKKLIILSFVVFAAVGLVFFAVAKAVKADNKFKVVQFAEVKPDYGTDGRAAVGSPAVTQVRISPALCWAKGDNGVKTWRVIGIIMLLLSGVYAAASHLGYITGNIHFSFVGYAIALGCFLGAYSSAFANNYKEISPTEYNLIKDNPAALESLFDKPLIK